MPRKAFHADLKEATGDSIAPGISGVHAGEEDGTFLFTFTSSTAGSSPIVIQALVPELSEYPSNHEWYLYTTEDNVPEWVNAIIEGITRPARGFDIKKLLTAVSTSLARGPTEDETASSMTHAADVDAATPVQEADDSEEEEDDDDDLESPWAGVSSPSPERGRAGENDATKTGFGLDETSHTSIQQDHIRRDARLAREAGLKVGLVGGAMAGGDGHWFISVSCRLSKLGISDETMQAWALDRNQYLILLLRYPTGYTTAKDLAARPALQARRSIEMRVRVGPSYKPTFQQALLAFSVSMATPAKGQAALNMDRSDHPGPASSEDRLGTMFISGSLDQLLNERLVLLLRSRLGMNLSWLGAETCYNDHQGLQHSPPGPYQATTTDDGESASWLPDLVTADHVAEVDGEEDVSFLLVAMQFLFRHLVRCTEFCLVCHCKVDTDFEALKPYVCSKPLCLYQYMSLGFGPSLEHEILAQPEVVDILISFCYASARTFVLSSRPTGMGLRVPSMNVLRTGDDDIDKVLFGGKLVPRQETPLSERLQVRLHQSPARIVFLDDTLTECPVKPGDWVIVAEKSPSRLQHCQITDTHRFPEVCISEPVLDRSYPYARVDTPTSASRPVNPETKPGVAELHLYNQNFDEMSMAEQLVCVAMLVGILPSLRDMKEFLSQRSQDGLSLAGWTERISPASLGMLKWIVASNRSCIMYVNLLPKEDARCPAQAIHGMPGWLQFRFAQGAPDKEQRFVNALRETAARRQLNYPSIFAWHGSPVENWHGIVREGLNFDKVRVGRAFGDGCYHSLDCAKALHFWPNASLKIHNVMCLNEIVNAPDQFVSRSPHLVVNQLDWIQTRYLFVKTAEDDGLLPTPTDYARIKPPCPEYPQDPALAAKGVNNVYISIPLGVFSSEKRPLVKGLSLPKRKKLVTSLPHRNKRQKLLTPDRKSRELTEQDDDVVVLEDDEITPQEDDDTKSVQTTQSDVDALQLLEDRMTDDLDENALRDRRAGIFTGKREEAANPSEEGTPKKRAEQQPMALDPPTTDFVPGSLNHGTLRILKPPNYATPGATRTLQREIQAVLGAQAAQPIHELGWYINGAEISNVYQWIVELHTFDPALPLAQDLKRMGRTSIVLEVRFGQDFPLTPPFVRVIRPRFVTFAQGGGGHVTAGGALCMELLTNTGWSPASSIESVLLQVRMAISSTEPFPARLEVTNPHDYSVREAADAFIRACKMHGWEVPRGFQEMWMAG